MLCTVPLQSLLDWLSKPKGPTLVEASVAAVPDKALALAVTKRMLYGEKPPLVGVGLVYKPHYISMVPFSAAYMHLNVWHSASSNQRPLEHCLRPHPPFDIGCIQATTQSQVGSPRSGRKVQGGKGVSNRCTYSWGVSST